MSTENHPNLHAVRLTLALYEGLYNSFRGKAEEDQKRAMLVLREYVVSFVADVSSKLDEEFGDN